MAVELIYHPHFANDGDGDGWGDSYGGGVTGSRMVLHMGEHGESGYGDGLFFGYADGGGDGRGCDAGYGNGCLDGYGHHDGGGCSSYIESHNDSCIITQLAVNELIGGEDVVARGG